MMKKITQGRTAEIYEHGTDAILKLYVSGFPSQAIQEEWEVSCIAHERGLPVPKALEQLSLNGRSGIVFERADGITLLEQIIRDPAQADDYARKLAALHWEMHQWRAEDMLRPQQDLWRGHIMQAAELEEEEKRKIIRYMDRLPGGDRICHGDFHPANVLMGQKDWILDWMTGTSGHPAGDVARTAILLQHAILPEHSPVEVRQVFSTAREQLAAVYLEHYCELSGLDELDIQRWYLPVIAARLVEWVPDEERIKLLRLIREHLDVWQEEE